MSQEKILALKKRELAILKAKKLKEAELPHLYRKHYKWSRVFYESTNTINLICSANQIGKSSVAIRRAIANATDPERWKKMWPTEPRMFWYFYPDHDTVNREFATKWQEWLPRGSMKTSATYGWKEVKNRTDTAGIAFNSGVTLYFMTYTKKLSSMQAGTVHEITSDEELPMQLYDELILRLTRTNGIFNSVFTPTLNQEFWREAIETNKRLPLALKIQVSMFDCITYEDGSPSEFFTKESIQQVIDKCKNETEIRRRVYGEFVTEEGRTFYAYDNNHHMIPRHPIPGWVIAAGVDYGSGSTGNHPSSIVFIAIRPDFQEARVIKAWRGDGIETTAGDLLEKYQEMKRGFSVMTAVYDPGARDFGTIAERCGENFIKANKARDYGEEVVNSLFRNGMLKLFDDDEEIGKLSGELLSMLKNKAAVANKKMDDLADALRYVCVSIPWDWSVIEAKSAKAKEEPRPMTEEELIAEQIKLRRGEGLSEENEQEASYISEIEEWNDLYG